MKNFNLKNVNYKQRKLRKMVYTPITEEKKADWIKWLESQQSVLDGKEENKSQNGIFETPDGDVATGKDLVGNLLALLSQSTVTIH